MSPGSQPDSGMTVVLTIWLPSALPLNGPVRKKEARPRAMKFIMIELMTSLTPRVTFRTATMPAQTAPTSMATTKIRTMCRGAGSDTAAPAAAAMIVASRY